MSSSTSCVTAQGTFVTKSTSKDPYSYQVGFGNRFCSEALSGVLPAAQNNPQKNKYGLYHEQITGTPYTAPQGESLHAWLYRIRPSVAHQGFTKLSDNPDIESCFLPLNPKVHVSPTQMAWRPFKLPSDNDKVDWVEGLKTLAGNGDPTLREGMAIHMYLANASMDRKAFCNGDGHMLICPQQGRLDIQTEFGKMMVTPGEFCVIQRGIKFKVNLPDGSSRGYILEVFGTHFTLPERGTLGSHGLANERDFESPLACFEIDQSQWKIVYKICGQLHVCEQGHTPFDVVAWHGNYVPYKYDMGKFVYVGSISRDHMDPSTFCILTAKSKQAGVPVVDFLCAGERWDVSTNTFRPPYYHRNAAGEFLALIYGAFPGRSDGFLPGGASFETGFCPHGVDGDVFKAASEAKLVPTKLSVGSLMIAIESSMPLTITDYAMNRCGVKHEYEPTMWDGLEANFLTHLDKVNDELKARGLPPVMN